MHDALVEILKLMKRGDSTHVRLLIMMNIHSAEGHEFMEALYKLRLKKTIIVQNLDILDINKIIDYHGFDRFNIKFWGRVYEYFVAIGDDKMLYQLTLRLAPHYKDELVHMLAKKQFFIPTGKYDLELDKLDSNLEIMAHVLRALDESIDNFKTSTVLYYIGTMFNPQTVKNMGIATKDIKTAIEAQQSRLYQRFVMDRFKKVQR